MTFKELRELERKGEKVLRILESIKNQFAAKKGIELKSTQELSLYGAGKPWFIVKHPGWFGKKVFYVRNVINNARQPSPIFLRVYDKTDEQEIVNLFIAHQKDIEEAQGVKVTFHTEESV